MTARRESKAITTVVIADEVVAVEAALIFYGDINKKCTKILFKPGQSC